MSVIEDLGLQAGKTVASGVGTAISTGINSLFGIDKYNDNRQIKQQQKLTDIQTAANEKLMKESYDLQQGMFDYTYSKNTAEAQVEQLKKQDSTRQWHWD